MEYRKIGEDSVSEIGMGCYALSGAYGYVSVKDYMKVIQRAHELGVTIFDTADTYGDEAERALGMALAPMRNDVFISTKVGVRGNKQPDLSYEGVKSACESSLKRMELDYLDLYLIHFDDPYTPVQETITALEDLKCEGKIRYYGVSHLPEKRIEEYLEKGNVSVVMMEFSAVAREAKETLFPLCKKHGAGILAFSVTGRGILTGKYDQETKFEEGDIRNFDPLFKHAKFQSALRTTKKLKDIGDRYAKTPIQVGISWVLSHQEVTSALTGPSSITHLEENLESSGWKIPNSELEELEKFFEKEERRLANEEEELVKEILITPLNRFQDNIGNLVYAMENAVKREKISEEELMPYFKRLWKLKDKPDIKELELIRKELEREICRG